VLSADGQGPLLPGVSETSERTQELIDQETRRIVEESHREARALLEENRDKLERLARELLAKETLDAPEAYAAAGVSQRAAEATPSAA
jgi:cell division protease FtsH